MCFYGSSGYLGCFFCALDIWWSSQYYVEGCFETSNEQLGRWMNVGGDLNCLDEGTKTSTSEK